MTPSDIATDLTGTPSQSATTSMQTSQTQPGVMDTWSYD